MHSIYFCIPLLFLAIVPIGALKILLYQTVLGHSHTHFSGALTDILTERGHTVDNLLMEWNSKISSNGTNKARRIIRVRDKNTTAFERSYDSANIMDKVDLPQTHTSFQETRVVLCKALLSQRPLLEDLKSEKYDIGLSSMFDTCGFGVFHLLNIKSTIGFSPTAEGYGMKELFGLPAPPSYVSDMEDQEIQGDRFSFRQRIRTFLRSIKSENKIKKLTEPLQSLFEEFYSGFPALNDLERNMTFVLVNGHEVLEIPKPTSAKVKHIGGIAIRKPKMGNKFSPSLEKALSVSKKGAVLLSFGSHAQTSDVTRKMKHEIARAFKHFPQYTFLWKVDDPDEDLEYYNKITNLYRFKWLPQTDLLFSNRIRAFITHGGENSYLESSFSGVPQIVISLFADQFYTGGCVQRNGQGVTLSKFNVTERSLVDALTEILYNPKYEKQAKRLSMILANYPEQPRETLVKYVELSAQFPELGQHLQLASANMDLFTYLSLDVILFLLLATVALVLITILIFRLPKYLLDKFGEHDDGIVIKEKDN